jgi:poly(glycerol-phosphate) alpha-glucosyltransferase
VRILLSTPYYAPAYAFGGPIRVLEATARAIVAAGHELTVVTTDALDHHERIPRDAPPVPPEAQVLRFPNVHHRLAAVAMGWTPRGYRAWLREHAHEYDVVHLNDIYSVVSVAAARAAERAGVPYVVQPHGSTVPSAERGKPLIKRAFLAAWGKRTLAEASALLAGTAAERADMVREGAREERIADIPPALDLPHVEGRAPLPETPTAVFLGRFDPIKRVDLLLEAAAAAGVAVRLVGAGAEEPRLRTKAAALGVQVEWAGFLDGEAKVRALQAAHVKVLLSRSEGLPVAALEAMACGTPVVLSEACNLPEIHDVGGRVTTPEGAADAIRRVLADRERLSAGAAAFAEDYRAERVLPRLLALYETLSTQSSERPQSVR